MDKFPGFNADMCLRCATWEKDIHGTFLCWVQQHTVRVKLNIICFLCRPKGFTVNSRDIGYWAAVAS